MYGDSDNARLFVGFPLRDEVRTVLRNAAAHLRQRLRDLPLRLVREENYHVTLHFLGDLPPARAEDITSTLRQAIADVDLPWHRTTADLGGPGAFPSPARPRVIQVPLSHTPQPLSQLHRRTGRLLATLLLQDGFVPDNRPYRPHITLAYVKKPPPRSVAATVAAVLGEEVGLTAGTLLVLDRLVLYHSRLGPGGSTYTELASIPAAGSV